MIKLYGRKTSSNVQVVMWGLGELGLDYKRFDYGHRFGGVDTPEYLALNPHGVVPTLIDGDNAPIWESAAILRYLASTYSDNDFWPSHPVARSQVDMWAEWGKTTFVPLLMYQIFWQRIRTSSIERNVDQMNEAIKKFEGLCAKLPIATQEFKWIVGDNLTLADLMIGHVLYRYFTMDIARHPSTQLINYYERLCERPAFQTSVMISYEELKVDGAD